MSTEPRQRAHLFQRQISKSVAARYLLALPRGYEDDPARRWPLLLFLHGAGERGDDLSLVRGYGPPRLIDEGEDLPFIVVSPQCPTAERWSTDTLSALLDEIERMHRVDPERIYVTGLSMGGFGAWALAIAEPHRFAAIAPICGGGEPLAAQTIAHLPVWTFHGARDDVVPLRRTEEMVEALREAGGDVRFTVYPDADHDSWTETYANPKLYDWLLSQRRTT